MSALPQAVLSRRILIVDDQPDLSEALATLLQLHGHTVAVACDVASGLATAATFGPDLIISDIGMPREDGHALARALRNDARPRLRDCYLVAFTGYAYPQDKERAIAAGFDEHLAKPTDIDAIVRLLDRIPSSSRQRKTAPHARRPPLTV